MSIDLMIDLETTGTKPGCAILSIGAATFDLEYKFYANIIHASFIEQGLKDDPSTIAWWDKQNAAARNEAFSGTTPLVRALGQFADFLRMLGPAKTTFVWGNGADFDLPILEAAYTAVGMKKPWEPWNGRCYRTLKNLYFDTKAQDANPTKHNALTDAVYQAQHARLILERHFARTQD